MARADMFRIPFRKNSKSEWRRFGGLSPALIFAGCAAVSYHQNSYTPTTETVGEASGSAEVRVVENLERESDVLYAKGYELVGFSHFISPLKPLFAEGDARRAAEERGATVALMATPTSERLNQHYYLTTFWRVTKDFTLGAYYIDLPPELLGTMGCEENNVVVTAVVAGSPAQRLGLQPGDLLLSIDGEPIPTAAFLDRKLLEKAGRQVEVGAWRRDSGFTEQATLGRVGAKPSGAERVEAGWPRLGLRLADGPASEEERRTLNRDTKIFVSGLLPAYPACLADVRTGDIVLAANGKAVASAAELASAVSAMASTDQITLQILRGEQKFDAVLDISAPAREAARSAQRLDIQEAKYATPWTQSQPKDWSALAALARGVSASAASYSQMRYQQQLSYYQAYQRQQAVRGSSAGTIETSRRGGYSQYVRAADGRLVGVTPYTANLLTNSPNSRLVVGRDGRQYLQDSSGKMTQIVDPARVVHVEKGVLGTDWLRYWGDRHLWYAQMLEVGWAGVQQYKIGQSFFPRPRPE